MSRCAVRKYRRKYTRNNRNPDTGKLMTPSEFNHHMRAQADLNKIKIDYSEKD